MPRGGRRLIFIVAAAAWLATAGCVRRVDPSDTGSPDAGRTDASGGFNDFVDPIQYEEGRVFETQPTQLAGLVGNPGRPCREPVLVRVTDVLDGDTLMVEGLVDEVEERVRLIGVDTPELRHSGGFAECYADEALTFTRSIFGRVVYLSFDAECADVFGRTLAYVHIGPEPTDVWERQLVRRGLADVLIVAPNHAAESILRGDRAAAQDDRSGLWGACR